MSKQNKIVHGANVGNREKTDKKILRSVSRI